jgi:nucleoside-diphosphate-sugar epimerase
MRILVTGGGGFLGSNIVKRLLARKDEVRVLARGAYPDLADLGATSIRGDVRDEETVRRAVDGVEAVFHVAARVGYWGPRFEYEQINIGGSQNMVEACRRAGVNRLVYTSSPSVVIGAGGNVENGDEKLAYPARHLNDYSATKARAEALVLDANRDDGLRTVAIRPHFIFGPGDPQIVPRLVENAKKGTLVRIGDGSNRVDVTYVDNAVEAHIAALDALCRPDSKLCGQAYFVGQEKPVLLWEFVDRVLEGFGVERVKKHISLTTARALGAIVEAVWTFLPIAKEPPLTRGAAVILGTSHYFSHDKARRDFGYEPTVSTEEGLRRLFDHSKRLA